MKKVILAILMIAMTAVTVFAGPTASLKSAKPAEDPKMYKVTADGTISEGKYADLNGDGTLQWINTKMIPVKADMQPGVYIVENDKLVKEQ